MWLIIGTVFFGLLYFFLKKIDFLSMCGEWLKELLELLIAGAIATAIVWWLWSYKTLQIVFDFLQPMLDTLTGKILALIFLIIIASPFITQADKKQGH